MPATDSPGASVDSIAVAKGFDSSERTVPGCNATTSKSGFLRCSSMAAVCNSMLSAAFDARYPYHPPSLLSAMLPTRAESFA